MLTKRDMLNMRGGGGGGGRGLDLRTSALTGGQERTILNVLEQKQQLLFFILTFKNTLKNTFHYFRFY